MKKKSRSGHVDELRPEYDLGKLLRKGVVGKYAKQYQEGTNLVPLAPDVAKAFPTPDSVNDTLRLVIELTRLRRKSSIRAKA